MFTIDPNISAIPLKGKNLFKALFSMNTHHVATPEMGLENARSYVFFLSEGGKRLSAYIGIYLLNSDRRLFYTYSANPFSEDDMGQVEDEARNFTEDLGAMLDELDCAHLSDLEKDQWIEAQDACSRMPEPAAIPETPAAAPLPPEPAPAAPLQQTPQPPPEPQEAPVPVQPVPVAPQPVQAPIPTPAAQPVAEPSQARAMQPQETITPDVDAPEPASTPESPVQPQAAKRPQPRKPLTDPLALAAETRKNIIQKAVKAGIIKAPQQSPMQEAVSPTSVVSREREALARLLTSF